MTSSSQVPPHIQKLDAEAEAALRRLRNFGVTISIPLLRPGPEEGTMTTTLLQCSVCGIALTVDASLEHGAKLHPGKDVEFTEVTLQKGPWTPRWPGEPRPTVRLPYQESPPDPEDES